MRGYSHFSLTIFNRNNRTLVSNLLQWGPSHTRESSYGPYDSRRVKEARRYADAESELEELKRQKREVALFLFLRQSKLNPNFQLENELLRLPQTSKSSVSSKRTRWQIEQELEQIELQINDLNSTIKKTTTPY